MRLKTENKLGGGKRTKGDVVQEREGRRKREKRGGRFQRHCIEGESEGVLGVMRRHGSVVGKEKGKKGTLQGGQETRGKVKASSVGKGGGGRGIKSSIFQSTGRS